LTSQIIDGTVFFSCKISTVYSASKHPFSKAFTEFIRKDILQENIFTKNILYLRHFDAIWQQSDRSNSGPGPVELGLKYMHCTNKMVKEVNSNEYYPM
jgi:hypothetical protein